MADRLPNFDIRPTTLSQVAHLFERYHPYRSSGRIAVYAFAVIEDERPVAAYVWQPPAPGAARSVCPALPAGVLALSRMVAVPREERRLRHVSKPLRYQMLRLIDRTRWPVLATYSDESVGHTGHVYKCSGWLPTKRRRAPTRTTADGARVSTYSNGKHVVRLDEGPEAVARGYAWLQRWEHWEKLTSKEVVERFSAVWDRVVVPGKTWRSGAPQYTYVRRESLEIAK